MLFRRSLWFLLLLAVAPAFSQSTSDNAATEALKKRLSSMDLLRPRTVPAAKRAVIAANLEPRICSIPLLRVRPIETGDKMRVAKPTAPGNSRELKLQVPAPACDEKPFANQ